jgi:hypothetical protein
MAYMPGQQSQQQIMWQHQHQHPDHTWQWQQQESWQGTLAQHPAQQQAVYPPQQQQHAANVHGIVEEQYVVEPWRYMDNTSLTVDDIIPPPPAMTVPGAAASLQGFSTSALAPPQDSGIMHELQGIKQAGRVSRDGLAAGSPVQQQYHYQQLPSHPQHPTLRVSISAMLEGGALGSAARRLSQVWFDASKRRHCTSLVAVLLLRCAERKFRPDSCRLDWLANQRTSPAARRILQLAAGVAGATL